MGVPARRPATGRGWRRFRVTREGKLFLLVTVGLGIAAVNSGNNLMFLVLGLLLGLVLVSGILSDLTLYRLEVEPALPRRAFAGAPCTATVTVRNRKRWLASYGLRFGAPVAGGPAARGYLLKVPPAATRTATLTFTPPRRGWITLEAVDVGTSHPFGLIEKQARAGAAARLLVYPALAPSARRGDVELLARQPTERPLARRGRGTELAGLRDFVTGDEVRDIHWARSAALGRLVTRERFLEGRERVRLVVDNARPGDADARWAAAFERAVSEAAWLAAFALERGLGVEVRARAGSGAALAAGSSPEPVWRFLAELTAIPADDAPALAAPGAGVVVLVPAP
jgi:uncharacterized protein (DUF58 family)